MGQSLRVVSFWLRQGTQNGVPWCRVWDANTTSQSFSAPTNGHFWNHLACKQHLGTPGWWASNHGPVTEDHVTFVPEEPTKWGSLVENVIFPAHITESSNHNQWSSMDSPSWHTDVGNNWCVRWNMTNAGQWESTANLVTPFADTNDKAAQSIISCSLFHWSWCLWHFLSFHFPHWWSWFWQVCQHKMHNACIDKRENEIDEKLPLLRREHECGEKSTLWFRVALAFCKTTCCTTWNLRAQWSRPLALTLRIPEIWGVEFHGPVHGKTLTMLNDVFDMASSEEMTMVPKNNSTRYTRFIR